MTNSDQTQQYYHQQTRDIRRIIDGFKSFQIPTEGKAIDINEFMCWMGENKELVEYYRKLDDVFIEKCLEHYIAYKFCDLRPGQVYIDIAASGSNWADCLLKKGIQAYKLDLSYKPGIHGIAIGANAVSTGLMADTVDAMSLQCAFETFQGDNDILFLREAKRILKDGGRVLISPLYVDETHFILSSPKSDISESPLDKGSTRVWREDEYNEAFSRHYSPQAVFERLYSNLNGLDAAIIYISNLEDLRTQFPGQRIYCDFNLLISKPVRCRNSNQGADLTTIYNNQFYEEHQDASVKSAQAVVPVILDVFKAQSVIDVGCGVGGWLHVFQKYGVYNILGFDGNELKPEKYYVDKNCIRTNVDFTSDQFKMSQKADLLICLEVAEHLPHSAADQFIRNLTTGSSAIIFSAAVPEQTGVNHVNEQPPWYWREKFNKCGYYEVDFIRPLIWCNECISWWYRQNITCYVTKEVLLGNSKLLELAKVHGQRKDPHKLTIINEWVLRNMFAAKVSQQKSGARQKIDSLQNVAVVPIPGASRPVSSVSVIIPTRNRAVSLEQTLYSLGSIQNPGCHYEIIVVDNGSTDTTRQTVESFRNRLADLRYVYEPNPGLHNGRHRGAFEARGQVLCYLDDDVKVDPLWLKSVVETFETTGAVLVGGKILPEYEQTPPDWVKEFVKPVGNYGYNIGQLTLIDLGEQIREIDPIYVWGANFSIRKDVLFECGGFRPDSMPKELLDLRGDGETGLSRAIKQKGYKAFYHPRAMVRHCISKDRLTVDYFCTRMFSQGISDSFTEIRNAGKLPNPVVSAIWEAYQKGKMHHHQIVQNNPNLLSWITRKDYFSECQSKTPASAIQSQQRAGCEMNVHV
ncbi:MAG TPA: glycosyltransferase [Anaerohalosphaeraceae bacterium]|nr:glycosyltransferase [Anaerohalosphaeraceae bacterium]